VFWVVDNGASHRVWPAAARLSDAFPNATMIHLPVHASWLNQVEIYFSVCSPTSTSSRSGSPLSNTATDAARPFDWRFNRDDLNRLIDRTAHDPPTN
jgi:hypothetical protein